MADQTPSAVDNPQKHRFELGIDGHTAFADYRLEDGSIVFTHTEVPEALGGRGIAKTLAVAGLNAARTRGLTVAPVCSFFAKYMKTHPETHDLLRSDYGGVLDD